MIRDSVVHEVDSVRFLLGEEITSVEVIKGVATSSARTASHDPMLVIFETESGAIVTDESFRPDRAWRTRCGPRSSASGAAP